MNTLAWCPFTKTRSSVRFCKYKWKQNQPFRSWREHHGQVYFRTYFIKWICMYHRWKFMGRAITSILYSFNPRGFSPLSPGQTESQVAASWELGSTCDSVWPGLACTCVDLRWLALTLVEIKFARKSTQVFHRLATQSKSTQVEWRPLTYY